MQKNLNEILEFVEELTKIDMSNKSIFELFTATAEELGELAREIAIKEHSFGNTYKKQDEGPKGESVDLAICALAVFFAYKGTTEEFCKTAVKKLKKWQKNQKNASKTYISKAGLEVEVSPMPAVVQKAVMEKLNGFTTVICQAWLESERGWGQRPDGFTLHLTLDDCQNFITDFNEREKERNPSGVVPDEYSRPSGEPYLIEVDKAYLKLIKGSQFGIYGQGTRAPERGAKLVYKGDS